VLKSIKRDDNDGDDDTGICDVHLVNWLVGQMRNTWNEKVSCGICLEGRRNSNDNIYFDLRRSEFARLF